MPIRTDDMWVMLSLGRCRSSSSGRSRSQLLAVSRAGAAAVVSGLSSLLSSEAESALSSCWGVVRGVKKAESASWVGRSMPCWDGSGECPLMIEGEEESSMGKGGPTERKRKQKGFLRCGRLNGVCKHWLLRLPAPSGCVDGVLARPDVLTGEDKRPSERSGVKQLDREGSETAQRHAMHAYCFPIGKSAPN